MALSTMLLAVLGGLILLVAAWRVTWALQHRVTTADDVQDSTGLVVIGPISGTGVSRPAPSTNRLPAPSETDGLESICQMLECNGLGSEIRVLTIVPASPRQVGDGFATNLARTLAAKGKSVVLIPTNLRPGTSSANGSPGFVGLAELLEGDHSEPETALVSDHLLVLPGGRAEGNPAKLLARPVLGEVIASLRGLGLIAIIDAPPASFADDVIPLAREADATLLIVHAGSRRNEVEAAASTLRFGRAGDPAAVLVATHRLTALVAGVPRRRGVKTARTA